MIYCIAHLQYQLFISYEKLNLGANKLKKKNFLHLLHSLLVNAEGRLQQLLISCRCVAIKEGKNSDQEFLLKDKEKETKITVMKSPH